MTVQITCPCGKQFDVVDSKAQRRRYCSKQCMYRYRTQPKRSHGLGGTSIYYTWDAMVGRCTDPAAPSYRSYGGRGISVYKPWLTDVTAFASWIDENLGPRPEGHTLDRINVDGDYEPGNLRWADHKTQAANTRARGTSKVGNRWRAQIARNGKNKHIGFFETEELAHAAYVAARKELS